MPYGIAKSKGGDSKRNDAKMETCVIGVMKSGKSKESAIRICKASIFDQGVESLMENEMESYKECKKTTFSEDETTIWGFSEIAEFKEAKEGETVEIQIMRKGKWNHPMYGEVKVDEETITDVIKNFDENKRGVDLAIDENHEPNHKALGWVKKLYKKGQDSLFATIELTKMGAELVSKGAYKYFSPEIVFNKKDEETGQIVKNLLVGGAFTNRPFFKAMSPLMACEDVTGQQSEDNNILVYYKVGMNKILGLLAKFAETQKLESADYETLKQIYSEMSDTDKTPELVKAFEEVTAVQDKVEEVVEEVKEVVEEVKEEVKEEVVADVVEETQKNSEEITITASEYDGLKAMAEQAKSLIKEKRKSEVESKVNGMKFSESNKVGVVLPKMVNDVVNFAMSLSETQSEKFLGILGKLQTVSASEVGHDQDSKSEFNEDAVAFFESKFGMDRETAIKASKEAK